MCVEIMYLLDQHSYRESFKLVQFDQIYLFKPVRLTGQTNIS